MKVKCIKNGGFLNLLTVGKTYEVIDEDNTKTYRYYIIDDTILDMDIGLKKKMV